jgi:tetraacyldisaccharide 4'-kinase
VTAFRAGLYAGGFFKTVKVERPVVSVGNLSVGGSRKTPMCAWLANALNDLGLKTAILSRGYGRKKNFFLKEPVLVSAGSGPLVQPEVSGDEPYLLAGLTGSMVLVCSRRVRAALEAQRLGADILILDDGFQHLALHRDVNILMLAGRFPLGNGRVLPAGPLRENLSAGCRAHLLVADRNSGSVNPWSLPVFKASLKLRGLKFLHSESRLPVEAVKSRRMAAFSGLARPGDFKNTLLSWGLNPVVFQSWPDHTAYDRTILKGLTELYLNSRADYLLTTAKDAVKLSGLSWPTLVLETELEPEEPDKLLGAVLGRLKDQGYKF